MAFVDDAPEYLQRLPPEFLRCWDAAASMLLSFAGEVRRGPSSAGGGTDQLITELARLATRALACSARAEETEQIKNWLEGIRALRQCHLAAEPDIAFAAMATKLVHAPPDLIRNADDFAALRRRVESLPGRFLRTSLREALIMTDANGDLLNAGARERLLCVLWDFDRFAQELTLPQRFDDQADWMRALITDSNDSDGGTGQPDLDQAIMAWLGEPARRARMVAWGWTDLALGSEPFILRFIVLQCLLRQLPDRLSDDFRNSLLFDLNLWVVSNPRVASGDDGEGSSERRESPFFNDEERAQVAFKRRMGAAWAHPVPRFDPEAALQLTDSLLAWRPGSPREPRLNLELVLASKLAAGWFPESEPTEVILGEQKYPARLCNERPGRPGKPPQGDRARGHFAARCMAIGNFAGTALPDVDANTVPVVCFHKPDEMFGPEFTAHLDATTTLSSSRFGLWRTILINPLVTDSKLRGYTKEPESRLFIAWCCWHQSVDKRFREDVFLPLHAARHPAMTKGAR